MSDWLHGLPVLWMAVVVFGATYLVAGVIYAAVNVLAAGERARAFKAISPGLLSPLGVLFGLLVIFTAAGVWGDIDRANSAVNREASELRSVVLLAASFPGEPEKRLRDLVRRYIDAAAAQEWPMMARHAASLTIAPGPLAEALQFDPPKVTARRRHSGRSRRQSIMLSTRAACASLSAWRKSIGSNGRACSSRQSDCWWRSQ